MCSSYDLIYLFLSLIFFFCVVVQCFQLDSWMLLENPIRKMNLTPLPNRFQPYESISPLPPGLRDKVLKAWHRVSRCTQAAQQVPKFVWGRRSRSQEFFPFKIMSYVHIPTNLQVKAQSFMFRCRKQARRTFHILLVQTYSRFRLFKGTEVTVEYIGHAMCFGEKLCFSKVSEEKNSQRAQVALNRWVWCKVRGWVYFDGHDKTLKSIGFIRIT